MKKTTKSIIIAVAVVLVLVGALFAVINLVPNNNNGDNTQSATYPTDANGEQYATDSKGNKIDSIKDKDGNIVSAGEVDLISKGPLKLEEIDVQNKSGQYTIKVSREKIDEKEATTPDGEPTGETEKPVYTIVGFEDESTQIGQPDSIANVVSNLRTLDIIDIKGENLKDYGLDKPLAVVTGKFTDGTESIVKIGNDAPGGTETYIQYGNDKAVYLVSHDAIKAVFYSPLDLISLEITPSSTTSENNQPISVTLTGTNYPQKVVLVSNDDETVGAYFKMTSPKEAPANVTLASEITGKIKGISAEKVLAVNPTTAQMKSFGLDKPVAQIEAKFLDGTIVLQAGKVDENGKVNIYSKDNNVVYLISANMVAWATASYDELKYEYIAKPLVDYVKTVKVTVDGKTYSYDLAKKTVKDLDGNETEELTVKSGGKDIKTAYFETFYNNLTNVLREESADKYKKDGSAVLKVEFVYNNGKATDTVEYYNAGNRKYIAQVNSVADGVVYETYINQIKQDVKSLAKNERVNPI